MKNVETLMRRFGALLRERRLETGLSQANFAERVGLNMYFIARIERGLQQPTLASIYRISKALGCAGSELLAELEAMAPGRKKKK